MSGVMLRCVVSCCASTAHDVSHFLITSHNTHPTRQWCDDNPDEPLSMELLGLLPAALESPTRLAVALFVATRWVFVHYCVVPAAGWV